MSNAPPNRIKELREMRGLTQQELADMMGVSKQDVSRYERGYTPLNMEWLIKFAQSLNVHPQDLLNIAAMSAAADEVVELPAEQVGPTYSALRRRGISVFKVLAESVADAGIKPGDVVSVDLQSPDMKTGDVIVARVNDHLVIRQFVAPRTLLINGAGPPIAIRTDDSSVKVELVGVVIRD